MLKITILAIIILAIAMSGMAIKILIKKDGKFPNIHISQNKALRQKGIKCAFHENMGYNSYERSYNYKNE